MAVQIPDPGTGNGQTGDNEYVFRKKVKDNFSDQTHAASRLVGTEAGNLMEVGAYGWGSGVKLATPSPVHNMPLSELKKTRMLGFPDAPYVDYGQGLGFSAYDQAHATIVANTYNNKLRYVHAMDIRKEGDLREITTGTFVILGINATADSNGFLKGASPLAEIYSDKMDLNQDAIKQGGITFEKLGVGDYLVKGSLGFAQEGWYIETPKDANGNVLVAVVYEQLANNDLSIKTYAKKFDEETGDIVANSLKSRDIPTGRFISLRLHELPKEPPVMPTESQPEV